VPQVSNTSSYFYGNSVPSSSLNIPSGIGQFGTGQGRTSDFVVHSFQVNQLLYDFGKTLGQIGQSKALYDASKMDLANIRQQVALDVKTAFFGYLAADRAAMVSEDNLNLNEDLLRQAQGLSGRHQGQN
jgi:outer membrane protein TolC